MIFKEELFALGHGHINTWCRLNGIEPPRVVRRTGVPDFGVCAYYRDGQIDIWVDRCASIGLAGRSWSYPGYSVDRTPYGVLAHELGHHIDGQHGPAGGTLSHIWRARDPEPLTGYCPNTNEWFAELFRLFVTNPDLLRHIRPLVYSLMESKWPNAAETRTWSDVLVASTRHVKAATNKIKQAEKKSLTAVATQVTTEP